MRDRNSRPNNKVSIASGIDAADKRRDRYCIAWGREEPVDELEGRVCTFASDTIWRVLLRGGVWDQRADIRLSYNRCTTSSRERRIRVM